MAAKKKALNIPRNANAINSKRRKSGTIKDRRTPRKGAKNNQAELLKDNDDE